METVASWTSSVFLMEAAKALEGAKRIPASSMQLRCSVQDFMTTGGNNCLYVLHRQSPLQPLVKASPSALPSSSDAASAASAAGTRKNSATPVRDLVNTLLRINITRSIPKLLFTAEFVATPFIHSFIAKLLQFNEGVKLF